MRGKKGRPKAPNKRRRRDFHLTEKAVECMDRVERKRKNFEFGKYVSEHILKDFEDDPVLGFLKFRRDQLNRQMLELAIERDAIVLELSKYIKERLEAESDLIVGK